MAKSWTLKEMAEAIRDNDTAVLPELGRRFPLTTVMLARIVGIEEAWPLIEAIPSYVLALRIEKKLAGEEEASEEEAIAAENEEEAPEKEAELSKEEKKRKSDRERQQRKRAKDKAIADAEKEAEEATAEEEAEAGKYDGISAVKLYSMCKERGIKVEPRKSQRHYIDLLEEDDMKVKSKDDELEDSDDGWGVDDEPAEEPKKKGDGQKSSTPKNSPTKKAEDDDDGGWDI